MTITFLDFMEATGKDWKQDIHTISLNKGFVAPSNMRPIIEAFLKSGDIIIQYETGGKHITMAKKSIYLTGEGVSSFVSGKTPRKYELVTDATPHQIATILKNDSFQVEGDNHSKIYDETGKEKKIRVHPDRKVKVNNDSVEVSIEGDDFKIETMRKGSEFTHSPKEDSGRRVFTSHAMYIPLTKSDGENKVLYDGSGTGYNDTVGKSIKTIGNAKEHFKDPMLMMKAIRMYASHKDNKLDTGVEGAIHALSDLSDKIQPEDLQHIKKEFIDGLSDSNVDLQKYIEIYVRTKLIKNIFGDLKVDVRMLPNIISNRKDIVLSLAWILRNNNPEMVGHMLSSGLNDHEVRSIEFLLNLIQHRGNLNMKPAGISEKQIKDWLEILKTSGY